jgi:hypothetical protein
MTNARSALTGLYRELDLEPGEPSGTERQSLRKLGDLLIGGRYHYDFSKGFGLTAYGDVGGFGVGAHSDWQLLGTIDYAPARGSTFSSATAPSTLTIPASDSNLGFNVHMKGPILAATFKF